MADVPEKLKALQKSYNQVFSTDEGKIIMADLERVCFYNSTTINQNPEITAFNEGQRAALLHIKTRVRMNALKLERKATDGQP